MKYGRVGGRSRHLWGHSDSQAQLTPVSSPLVKALTFASTFLQTNRTMNMTPCNDESHKSQQSDDILTTSVLPTDGELLQACKRVNSRRSCKWRRIRSSRESKKRMKHRHRRKVKSFKKKNPSLSNLTHLVALAKQQKYLSDKASPSGQPSDIIENGGMTQKNGGRLCGGNDDLQGARCIGGFGLLCIGLGCVAAGCRRLATAYLNRDPVAVANVDDVVARLPAIKTTAQQVASTLAGG